MQTKYITETDKLKLENERLNSNETVRDLNKQNQELEKKVKVANDQVDQFSSKINELQNEINEFTKQNKNLKETEAVCKNYIFKFKNIDDSIKEQTDILKRPIYEDQKQNVMNELCNKIIQKQNLMGTLFRDRNWGE